MLDKDGDTNKITKIFKEAVDTLHDSGFDIHNKLRFYNMIPNSAAFQRCSLGNSAIAIGTNLEVWPCQALIDKKILGYYDENIKTLLETSEDNKYYYNRTLLRECVGCPILVHCRGGCRASHSNLEAIRIACRIKREIMMHIFNKPQQRFKNSGSQKHGRGHQEGLKGLENIINTYLKENPDTGVLEKTPPPLADIKKGE